MSVTIVVPVYGDLPSLTDCVDALLATVDLAEHRVLLVNDCGPDADAIERALLARIDGVEGVRYERNPANLGFVGTCNRAATELDTSDNDILLLNSDAVPTPGFLDEMAAVLAADPAHGVVTARSNNATIASLPFRLTDGSAARTFERTREVHAALVDALPRWYEPPVAMGFCFLVRRELIRRFGLFDEAFAPGYGEENDFCLRIGEAGFRSVIANRALVFHAGSKSFAGAQKNALRTAHQRELDRRYPYLGEAVQAFLRYRVVPADRFADVLVPAGRPRVVLDARGLPAPAAAVEGFLSAFGTDAWRPEVVVDEGAKVSAQGARIATTAGDDDLVAATFLPADGVVPRHLVAAHRRSLLLATWAQELDAPASTEWTDDRRRVGADEVRPALAEWSSVRVGPWPDAAVALRAALDAPLDERIALVTERYRALALVDRAVDAAGEGSGAEVERLRAELRDLRGSRTYRLGAAIARMVPRRR